MIDWSHVANDQSRLCLGALLTNACLRQFGRMLSSTGPDSDIGYAFSNICLALALLTNAVIIGSATNLLSNMDAGAVAKKTQMDGINGYMRYRKVREIIP